jgi:hypothetical protein
MYINVNAERAAEDYSYSLYYVHILYGAAAADCVEVCIQWRRRRCTSSMQGWTRGAVYCCRAEFIRESYLHFVSQRIASERKIPRAKSENPVHFSSHTTYAIALLVLTVRLIHSSLHNVHYVTWKIASGSMERNHQFFMLVEFNSEFQTWLLDVYTTQNVVRLFSLCSMYYC